MLFEDFILLLMKGGSYVMEHGPIFSTVFGKIVYIFSGFRKTGILSDTEILYFEGRNTANNATEIDTA